ncbi:extracellular solute-binding protein [Microbacterium gorillae]|uniref:extracellular solute-binding protein n=1 Tax=Microbacterium gorillae TaxID=1231063 RepID=UPI00058C9E43|nr:extracellular solute-binding protein [Microbacterium gorillae]
MARRTTRSSRRIRAAAAVAVPALLLSLAACGTSGPAGAGGGGSDTALMWSLSGAPNEKIHQDSVDAFNKAHPDEKLEVSFIQNDAYKTKIRTAIGAGQAPTLIYGWGGGTLKSYVDAGQVEDLTGFMGEHPEIKDKLFPGVFDAATIDGKIYAMPINGVQPVVLYYNKKLFSDAGVQPPKTWDDLMAAVKTFNAKGIAPISLAGQSRWTSMMWLEYLFDRVGGPAAFNDVFAGKTDAWSNPDIITALTMAQDLVKADGFVKGFASVTAESNADQALLYTGKAAMMLQGGWAYANMKADGQGFVQDGNLGFLAFPSVEGGKGDPADVAGNPANYLSISATASDEQKKTAKDYLAAGLYTDTMVDAYISSGAVPVVNGIQDKIAKTDDADFLSFAYDLSSKAPSFQQSWDQALSPTAAEELLNNIEQLFSLTITPQQFADNMNKTIGK